MANDTESLKTAAIHYLRLRKEYRSGTTISRAEILPAFRNACVDLAILKLNPFIAAELAWCMAALRKEFDTNETETNAKENYHR